MSSFYTSITEAIGNTPLIRLDRIKEKLGLKADIYAKLEYFNPAGSAKDRVALQMIRDYEESGVLKPGGTIIEPTSGNTGIGLAMVGVPLGYRVIIVMPDTMSEERRRLIGFYGAELVLSDGALGMSGASAKAEELCREIPGSIIAGQFCNMSNPKAHYLSTGPEIFSQLDGNVNAFVAGVGTGGTISGTGRYLKDNIPGVYVLAAEPDTSPLLSEGHAGHHGIQGIGADFIPEALDTSVYDEIMTVSLEDSYKFGRLLAVSEGICSGISSGCALSCAVKLAERAEFSGKNIVVLLPDSGDRYISTDLFKM